MLKFEDFIRMPWCKPLVLKDEDQPQDYGKWKQLERENQERQYARYVRQWESGAEEPAVDKLRNNVTLQENGLRNKKSRAEYMRAYRKRARKCPHCGKQL